MSSDSILDDILAAAESMSVSGGSPPSVSGVSSTPVRHGAPCMGGWTAEGTVIVKLFYVIDIECTNMSYCFGIIGNGSAFCVKKNCTVKTHASVKMTFAGEPESYVFIRRNIPGTVFSKPRLSSSKVPEDVMSDWMSKTLSISDWSTEFQAIDGISEQITSVEEIQNETDFLAESSIMRTPGKRKKDSFAGEEFEGPMPAWKNQRYDRSLPSDPGLLESLINEGIKKGILTTTVSRIEDYIEEMGYVLTNLSGIHHECLVTLEDNLEVMIGMLQTMKARIGTAVNVGERFTAPTLWGTTAFIADDLTKAVQDLYELQADVITPLQQSVLALSSADWCDTQSKAEKVVKVVKLLLSRVKTINDSVTEVKADLVLIRAEQGIRFSNANSSLEEPSDELMDFILSEESVSPSDVRTH